MPSVVSRISLLKTLAGSSIVATGDIVANRIALQEMAKNAEQVKPVINLSSIYRYSANFAALSAAVLKPDNSYAVGAFAAAHNNAMHAIYDDLMLAGVIPPAVPATTSSLPQETAVTSRLAGRRNRH